MAGAIGHFKRGKACTSWSTGRVCAWRALCGKAAPHIGIAADSTQSGAASSCHVLPSEKHHITQWEALFLTLMFQVDDIKCEYHPSSGMAPKVHAFNDFKHHPTPLTSMSPDKRPWAPFKLWLEIEIAELALEACLNNEQTDCLIKFCNWCASWKEKFTFQNHKDICNKWDAVSNHVTGVHSFWHQLLTTTKFY